MAFDNRDGLVGVSFSENKIKLVEVEFSGGQYQINRILQKNVNLPENFYNGLDLNARSISQVGQILNETVSNAGLKFSPAVLTLNSEMVLFKKVPVDSDLPEAELKSQIYWEAEQIVTNPINEYNIDFNRLQSNSGQPYQDLLVVMVRKVVVDFWRQVFQNTKLDLKIIDVDLFAAIRAIKSNYEYQEGEKIGLIDVGSKIIKLTLMLNGDFFYSSAFNIDSSQNNQGTNLKSGEEELSRIISKQLRRLILDHKLGKYIDDLNRIFLYGENLSEGFVESLQNAYNVRINKVNPFRKVRFLSSEVGGAFVRDYPETFVVCVGAALRKN